MSLSTLKPFPLNSPHDLMRFLPGVTPVDFATLAGPSTALSPNNDGATDSCRLATEGVTGTTDPTDTTPAGNVGVTGTSSPETGRANH